jgi:hypothetical protein
MRLSSGIVNLKYCCSGTSLVIIKGLLLADLGLYFGVALSSRSNNFSGYVFHLFFGHVFYLTISDSAVRHLILQQYLLSNCT